MHDAWQALLPHHLHCYGPQICDAHSLQSIIGPTLSAKALPSAISLTRSSTSRCTTSYPFHTTPQKVVGRGVETTCTMSSPFDSQDNIDTVITFPQSASLHCWVHFVCEGDITLEGLDEDANTVCYSVTSSSTPISTLY